MSCRSDIDLATLHQHRLEERWNYGLTWVGAHGRSQELQQLTHYNELLGLQSASQRQHRHQHPHQQLTKSNFSSCSRTVSRLKDNVAKDNQDKPLQGLEYYSNDYFTATTRRRRSGTWP